MDSATKTVDGVDIAWIGLTFNVTRGLGSCYGSRCDGLYSRRELPQECRHVTGRTSRRGRRVRLLCIRRTSRIGCRDYRVRSLRIG